MKTYPSKIGIGLVIFIGVTILLSSIFMVLHRVWSGLAVNLLVLAFITYIFKNTYYSIDETTLQVKCGFLINKSIAISSIYEIRESRNPISAPATSLDRLEIFYNSGNSVLVSPREKMEFVDHLTKLNGQIKFKG